ncbi:MAG: hypothetical protein JSV98_01125 [candidate division WOR-3 bacterium]|nr:MAG: hypothetical protein JSV98_01125 [candidate division WOR-3 bacterium]
MRVTPLLDTIGTIPVKDDIGVEREPDITFDGSNYIVVWSEGDFGGMHKVRAGRVTTQGAVLDSGILFGKDSYLEYHPSVSFGGGHCLAVWYAYDAPYGVFGRFLDELVQPIGDAFDIAVSQTNHSYNPDIAYADGRFLIVWNEQTAYAGDEIYGQIVDTSGALINDRIPIAVGPGYQSMQRVSGDNAFLTVWNQNGNIYGQWISLEGQLIGENFQISDPLSGDRLSPDIAIGAQNCMAVWMQYDVNSYDIFGNLDMPAGIHGWQESWPYGIQAEPTIFAGSLKRFIDKENTAVYDISGRRIHHGPVSPGIYFIIDETQAVVKAIKVR